MMRTILDIEAPILKELKLFTKQHQISFGKAATQLLMEVSAMHKTKKTAPLKFE